MSNPHKQSSSGSKSSSKGFAKESKTHQQKSSVSEAESTVLVTASPTIPSPEDRTAEFTFKKAMRQLQIAALTEVINEGNIKINDYISQINGIASKIPQRQQDVITNSKEIIELLNWLIEIKSDFAGLISWWSVMANVVHHLVISFEEQHLPEKLLDAIEEVLPAIENQLNDALTKLPRESILGISLAPDKNQISETKAVVSDILSRIDKIKQENEEASKDWGTVEQNAYERILEGSTKNVSGEQFLSWLSDLEQGRDV